MMDSLLRQAPSFESFRLPAARHSSSSPGELLAALAVGMLAGAATALLLAPKPGSEMRKDLRRRLSFTRDPNEEFAERVRAEGGLPPPDPMKHVAP